MTKVIMQNKPSYECMMKAETALALSRQSTNDSFMEYHCSAGLIFLAFAVEAMFIFYRRQVDSDYDKKRDKTGRTKFHKKTLELCGIKNYLGSRDYQIVKTCFDARDSIAHGDFFESSFEFTPTVADEHNMFAEEILTQSSEQFRKITLEILEKGIIAAKRIDEYIYDNGYKVDEDIELEFMPKLQPAFGVSGIYTW